MRGKFTILPVLFEVTGEDPNLDSSSSYSDELALFSGPLTVSSMISFDSLPTIFDAFSILSGASSSSSDILDNSESSNSSSIASASIAETKNEQKHKNIAKNN